MKIKCYLTVAAVAFAVATYSCSKSDSTSNASATTGETADNGANAAVLAERDSLIALFNDISGDMLELKRVESIITVPSNLGSESGATPPTLRDDVQAIRLLLADRRQRLEELERKLAGQSGENLQLTQMISNLRMQIEQNESTINTLNQQLAAAHSTISELNTTVDSLSVSVADATAKNEALQQQTVDLTDQMNRCYYALGSKKELKDHKIIETGFLRKTKIMQGDYETSYFVSADKRTLTRIPLHSKKVKVWTSQPKDSYTITAEPSGNKVLNITNPQKFWAASNYLVIQTD